MKDVYEHINECYFKLISISYILYLNIIYMYTYGKDVNLHSLHFIFICIFIFIIISKIYLFLY